MGYLIGYCACGAFLIFAIIVAGISQHKINSAYEAYRDENSSLDLTASDLALKLAVENNIELNIKACRGKLTDHYNPKDKSLNISEANYNSKSIAAQAIVAHEFGHALQDAQSYKPMKIRHFVIKFSNFMSSMLIPLIIVGVLLQVFITTMDVGSIFIYIVVGFYALSVIIGLATLPVEYNASSRAKELLYNQGCTSDEEVLATKRLLNAAALTYVASLLVSLAYFLRFLLIVLASSKKD